jgi:hypothetical protein
MVRYYHDDRTHLELRKQTPGGRVRSAGRSCILIRDSVACTIDMNLPHNSILRDRGLSARNNPGTPARGKKGTTIRGLS